METFLSSFSNREYATAFLIVMLFLYGMIKNADVIKSLLRVLRLLFFSKLTILYLIPTLYLIAITYLMFKCNFWNNTLLKDSIFSIFGCLFLFGKAIGTDNFNKIYKENIFGYISTIYFLEFFVNFYDFNFIVEVVLVTFVALVCATSTYMEYSKEETQNVKDAKQLLNGIQICIGAFIIIHSIYCIIKAPTQIFSFHSFQILLLPIIYTLSLYPICYAIYIYAKYETVLTNIHVVRNNLNQQLSSFKFAYKTFLLCGANIKQLKLWEHFFLSSYSSYDVDLNIDNMVKEFRQKYKRLDSPQTETDISLDLSLAFMVESGFPVSLYKYSNYSEGYGYYQSLSYNSENRNRYYSVTGNQQYPQYYVLHDYIQDAENLKRELKTFSVYCDNLYNKIFSENLDNKYVKKILNKQEFSFERDLYNIKFQVDKSYIGKALAVILEIKKITPTELCEYELECLAQNNSR